jgi:hypothetical protein
MMWPFYESAAISITPTVDGSVKDGLDSPKDGNPDHVSEGSIVQALNVDRSNLPFEDRGIIEFDISSLSLGMLGPVTLDLPVVRSMGPFPFTIDVFSYVADGSLSLGDFNAGSPFTSFDYFGAPHVALDVTSVVHDLQLSGSEFLGFNFQFAVPTTIPSNGPYIAFNSLEFLPSATLVFTIPEPSTLLLLLVALLGLVVTVRWKHQPRR